MLSIFINSLSRGVKVAIEAIQQAAVVYDANESISGAAAGTYVDGDFRYSSSIDAITDLYATYSYDSGFTGNLPVVFVGHGYGGDATTITYSQMHNYAAKGFFVINVGMRGRNAAGGTKDSSGREIYDLYDALIYTRNNFALTSAKKVAWSGFSGGGGNGMVLGCRFPDLCNVIVSHYGMSDYGEDGTTGWWYTNTNYQPSIEGMIGGSPTTLPDDYKGRNAKRALPYNFLGGKLRMYHNNGDTAVSVVHSQQMANAYDTAGKTNYVLTLSDTLYPHANYDPNTLVDFEQEIKDMPTWNFPVSGKAKVIGWLKTKHFETRLGDMDNEVADLEYDINTGKYIVTPLTGSMVVNITQGVKSANQTISQRTEIIL